jgi:lipoate-protein ligase A
VVLVEPGGLVWVDVLVPAGDPLWDPDVGRAFGWLGRAWAAALADAGVPGARVHEGAPAAGPWSALVCFAGLGPGEVTVGGAKVVGISARRTRAGALFQSAALLAWDAESLVGLLAEHPADPALLADLAAGAAVDAVSLTGALLARLAGC